MKINIKEKDYQQLMDTLDENIFLGEFYNHYLLENYATIQEEMIKKYGSFYQTLLYVEEIKENSIEEKIIKKHGGNDIVCLSSEEYLSNPFFKTIQCENIKEQNWELFYNYYAPYEGFVSQDVYVDENQFYLEKTHLAFFKETFPYLAVLQDGKVWMSITPHEMNTMKESIQQASGKIVVYGLGLGYFPFMCSLKESVEKITIIEKDENVISLFKKYLLNQFPNKEKINIVCEDALTFAKKDKKFDYAFVDLWHDADDGVEIYIRMKQLEKENIVYSYWIEDSLLSMIRRCLLVLVDESYKNQEFMMTDSMNFYDKLIHKLYLASQDVEINDYNRLKQFLSKESILSLIKKIRL